MAALSGDPAPGLPGGCSPAAEGAPGSPASASFEGDGVASSGGSPLTGVEVDGEAVAVVLPGHDAPRSELGFPDYLAAEVALLDRRLLERGAEVADLLAGVCAAGPADAVAAVRRPSL